MTDKVFSDPEQFQRMDELFHAAMELPSEQREAYLQRQCQDNQALLKPLMRMIAHAEKGFMDLTSQVHNLSEQMNTPDDRSGARIGPYQLQQRISYGGMAEVYLADRVDGEFEQQVAIKLIRSDRVSDEMIQRFQAERKLLAKLQHPNICQLFDGGRTGEGEMYFIMEYINGGTLLEQLDNNWRSNINKFLTLCSALSYAHNELIVHCDIKPSNVLVDPSGAVKLLDFGIASVLQSQPDHPEIKSTQSWYSADYAAPEIKKNQHGSVASDVFSLGVLLKALINTDTVRNQLPDYARLELKLISEKAASETPAQRYSNVSAFAGDIQKTLHQYPISLLEHKRSYRIKCYLQRNKLAASFTLALLASAAILFARETQLRLVAEQERENALAAQQQTSLQLSRANEVTDFLVETFKAADLNENRGESPTAEELLDQAFADIQRRDHLASETRIELLMAIGNAYTHSGEGTKGIQALQSALETFESSSEVDELLRARIINNLGSSIHRTSSGADTQTTLQLILDAIEVFEQRLPADDFHLISAYNTTASIYIKNGELEQAGGYMQQALEQASVFVSSRPGFAAAIYHNAARLERNKENYQQALEYINRSLQIKAVLYGEDETGYATGLLSRSQIYRRLGEWDNVEADLTQLLGIYQQQLSPDNAFIETALNELANYYHDVGKFGLAEEKYQEQLKHPANIADPKRRALTLNNLGFLYMDTQQYQRALPLFIENLQIRREFFAENSTSVATAATNLGRLYRILGEPELGRPLLEHAVAVRGEKLGNEHNRTLASRLDLAWLKLTAGDVEASYQDLTAIEEKLIKNNDQSTNNWSLLHQVKSAYLLANGDPAAAVEQLQLAHSHQVSRYGEQHPLSQQLLQQMQTLEDNLSLQ